MPASSYLPALAHALVTADAALVALLLERIRPEQDTEAVVLEAMVQARRTDLLAAWLPQHPHPHARQGKVLLQVVLQDLADWVAPLVATLSAQTPKDHWALTMAASRGQLGAVQHLHPHYSDADLTLALACACESDHPSTIAALRQAMEARLDQAYDGQPEPRAQAQRQLLDRMLASTVSHPGRDLTALLAEGLPGSHLADALARVNVTAQEADLRGWAELCAQLPLSYADILGPALIRKSAPTHRGLDQVGIGAPRAWQAQWLATYGADTLPGTAGAYRTQERQACLAKLPATSPGLRRPRA